MCGVISVIGEIVPPHAVMEQDLVLEQYQRQLLVTVPTALAMQLNRKNAIMANVQVGEISLIRILTFETLWNYKISISLVFY